MTAYLADLLQKDDLAIAKLQSELDTALVHIHEHVLKGYSNTILRDHYAAWEISTISQIKDILVRIKIGQITDVQVAQYLAMQLDDKDLTIDKLRADIALFERREKTSQSIGSRSNIWTAQLKAKRILLDYLTKS